MRILSPLLFATALAAADVPAPLATASLPDVQRTIERFNQSIYGTLWSDPQMAPLRAKMLESMDEHAAELGFKISDLLLGSRHLAARLDGFVDAAEAEPQFEFVYAVGPLAEPLFTTWQKSSKKNSQTQVAGANAAFTVEGKDGMVVARFGEVIAGGTRGIIPAVWAPGSDEADVVVDLDSRKLLDALLAASPERQRAEIQSATVMMEPYLGPTTYRSRIIAEGMLERYVTSTDCPWLVPVDRPTMDRLPPTAMAAMAMGFDGRQFWAAFKQPLLDALAKEQKISQEEALAKLDAELAATGMTVTFSELMEGLTGTFALAIAPGAPFPSLTLTAPRTPAIDQVVTTLLGLAQAEAPEEGASVIIPVPNLPVPITLARDATGWMITSDALYPTDWLAKTGGFLASPAAKLAIERGGAGASIIGCSDTPVVLRTILPYLAMGLGQMRELEPAQRQSILQLLQTAAAKAGTGYVVSMPEQGGMAMEMRGLLTYSAFPAIVGAIAIPNLLESRVASQEAAAASMLKSAVLPAQVQFQAGGYSDVDGDGLGDFGFFEEMSGDDVGNGITLSLLGPDWHEHTPLINGYRFATYLPDDRGGAVDSPDGRRTVKGDDVEMCWVAYAWPDEEGNGRRMFAINQSGNVYTTEWDGQPPAWNALWSGAGTWKDKPTWQPYRRPGR